MPIYVTVYLKVIPTMMNYYEEEEASDGAGVTEEASKLQVTST